MHRIAFKQVDVFTSIPYLGNPVAVVLDATGVTGAQMQQIARWTNLSETTFVLPPTEAGAHYRVRIFTPGAELPFAGHPTIGTANALLEAGLVQAHDGVLVQQCAFGLIKLAVTATPEGARSIAFELPTPTISALDDAALGELRAILGTPTLARHAPLLVDVGARWIVAQLPSAQAVLDAQPDLLRMKAQDRAGRHTGVVLFGAHPAGSAAAIELRAFAPAHGIDEDPVCGSGAGCMGAFIVHSGQVAQFGAACVAHQGQVLGRAGVLRLAFEGSKIRVGGAAVTCIDGVITLPRA